jgi:hypothetical protein
VGDLLTDDTIEQAAQERELVVASDERCRRPGLDIHAEPAAGLDRTPDRDRLLLALHEGRLELLVHDPVSGRPVRELTHHDAVDGGDALEPRRDVHDIARHESLPGLRPGAQRDDRLAGVHRAADREVQAWALLVQLRDRVQDAQRSPDRALGVVLVREGSAEHGHHGIADELLHRACPTLDLAPEHLVVETERRSDVLGIGAIGARGESDEVDEQDGNDLALLAGRCGRHRERGAASRAEPSPLRVLLAAVRASHGRSVGPCLPAGSRSTSARCGS